MIKKLLIVGGLATAGLITWSFLRKGTAWAADVPTDAHGNPEGTIYDEAGRARRPPPPTPEADEDQRITREEWAAMQTEQNQEDLTRPVSGGGLRYHPGGLLLDDRYVPAGRLLHPLTVYDGGLFVEQPSRLPQWRAGQVYLVTIEGERMLVQARGLSNVPIPSTYASRGMLLQILARPQLGYWPLLSQTQHTRRDDALEPDEPDNWPQYNGRTDPVYTPVSERYITGQGIVPGGRTVYVHEYRHNCYAEEYADCAGRCTWDPTQGICRERTPEEQQAYEDAQAAAEEAQANQRARDAAAREEWSQRVWGIPYDLYWRLRERQADSPSDDECAVRRQAVFARSAPITQPCDLWAYAPQYAPGSVRAVALGVDCDDTMADRRERGRLRYTRLSLVMRREYHRDWYAITHGSIRAGYGEPVLAGAGGFYGFAALWGEPQQPRFERADTTTTTTSTQTSTAAQRQTSRSARLVGRL